MEITKKSQKNSFKAGYSAEKAIQELGTENLEEQAFNVLNIEEAPEKKGIEYLRIYVHTPSIKPFAVKVEQTSKMLKKLEEIEIYAPIKLKNLEACVIKKPDIPKMVYYQASDIEVL